ncbi:MAG: hypothetical protein CVU57_12900 [Deltaproteobacteria bacterium HGW-Deltaproteobacteria-15]|jgi:hypothetical protein|nr:MAG: hypothetical protein CVU57_12900 [Deltaproteobacteria bacterium HGW-Deltaproteobacteria-15]
MDYSNFHQSQLEQLRKTDLIRLFKLLPGKLGSVLEIGARDEYYSKLLSGLFDTVTALDLTCPNFQLERVSTVKGDVTRLDFLDDSFECVVATEVLEHVREIDKACGEISRVANKYVIVGVPYKQDLRVGRTTCFSCGQISPPWGHLNTFDEKRLRDLFSSLEIVDIGFVGENTNRTNPLSRSLMDAAGNPWGTYHEEAICIHCGSNLITRPARSTLQRIYSAAAYRINLLQGLFIKPWPNWIHVLFRKDGSTLPGF